MNLELYYKPTCPFCEKVIQVMKAHNISIPLKNISQDNQAKQTLIKIGGKKQVPCLMINGQALYESDAIIDWLLTHYKSEKS